MPTIHESMVIATSATLQGFLAVLVGLLKSVRPKQFAKNGLILFALFFTVNKWWEPADVAGMAALVGKSLGALAVFTALSGAVYLVNDLFDIERDRLHPRKRYRPIAAGVVPTPVAVGAAVVLGAAGLAAAFAISIPFGLVAAGYAALMQAYNIALKHMVILDVMAIAAGFVLRAVAGSVAIDHSIIGPPGARVELDLTMSPWLYICTALGALFIALAKRRSELLQAGNQASQQRAILQEYTVAFTDQMIVIVAPAVLIAYTLYTFSGNIVAANLPANNSMMFTIPFVAYGIFRYLYLMYRHSLGEAPEDLLLTDRPLLINIVLWLITAAAVLLVNSRIS